MPEPNENEIAPLPKWSTEERALWLDLMESFSSALLPADEDLMVRSAEFKERKAIEAVTLGAKLADVAVQEFQFRQFAQASDADHGGDAAGGFEQFAAWLTRSRAPHRKKKSAAIKQRRKR